MHSDQNVLESANSKGRSVGAISSRGESAGDNIEDTKVETTPEDGTGFFIDEVTKTDAATLLPSSELSGKEEAPPDLSNAQTYPLKGGGFVAKTSAGLIQVGIPPETIKDSMNLGATIPTNFVIMGR